MDLASYLLKPSQKMSKYAHLMIDAIEECLRVLNNQNMHILFICILSA